MGVDPTLERRVRAELSRRDSRARRSAVRHDWPRTLVTGLHFGAGSANIEHLRVVAHAPGTAGRIARVVGRAALADLLQAAHPVDDHLAVLGMEA